MTTLKELRAGLAETLGTDAMPAHAQLPSRLVPPCIVVEPSAPYVTDDVDELTYGQYRVAYDLVVVMRPGTPDRKADDLDDAVTYVLDALDGTQWTVSGVEDVITFRFGEQGATFLAAPVTVRTDTHL